MKLRPRSAAGFRARGRAAKAVSASVGPQTEFGDILMTIRSVERTFPTVGGGFLQALAPISLEINAGEIVSIVGPSGCGKTTLLRILAGLDLPSSGTVTLRGREITGPRHDVGIVFQEANLLEWRNVRGNVLLPAEIQHRDLNRAGKLASELLAMSGLGDFEAYFPHQLSGGMQQRVAIARALIIEPSMLLLDEPFGALDAMTRERMNLELATLCEQSKITTILITHSIEEAVLLSDRVVVLGPSPGHVMEVIDVPLSRPRTIETFSNGAFVDVTAHLRSLFSAIRPPSGRLPSTEPPGPVSQNGARQPSEIDRGST